MSWSRGVVHFRCERGQISFWKLVYSGWGKPIAVSANVKYCGQCSEKRGGKSSKRGRSHLQPRVTKKHLMSNFRQCSIKSCCEFFYKFDLQNPLVSGRKRFFCVSMNLAVSVDAFFSVTDYTEVISQDYFLLNIFFGVTRDNAIAQNM